MDYHVENCGVDSYKKVELSLINTFWPGIKEDEEVEDVEDVEVDEQDEDLIETQYLNGNNEVVKILIKSFFICYERNSIYAFRQSGHQCFCEHCYQIKSDFDILKCVFCRT